MVTFHIFPFLQFSREKFFESFLSVACLRKGKLRWWLFWFTMVTVCCMAPFSHNDCVINLSPALEHYWVTSHPFIILNAYKNQQPNNIYSWKQQQYLQAILCEMFLWIRKGKVLSIEFLLSNTIVLIVLYNGMIILIIKSKGCLKLVSTTAQKLSLTLCVLVSPRMDTIASRDQFKPIRFGEKLVANYNLL